MGFDDDSAVAELIDVCFTHSERTQRRALFWAAQCHQPTFISGAKGPGSGVVRHPGLDANLSIARRNSSRRNGFGKIGRS